MPAAPAKSADVEMGDVKLENAGESEVASLIQKVVAQLQSIQTATLSVDLRTLSKTQLALIKRRITGSLLRRCIETFVVDTDPIKEGMLTLLKAEKEALPAEAETALKEAAGKAFNVPEITYFFAILVLDYLFKNGLNPETFCAQLSAQLGKMNRRTMDFFASRIYGYYARAFKDSDLIRNDLLAIYRTASLRRDAATQATVLNLILRNYVEHNLFEQAAQFVSKTTFPENRTNAEFARYLFYIGRMKSIQLQYSEAHSKLMQAIRKAPQNAEKALAFKVLAWKFALTVELLMGEIPARKHFLQPEFKEYLQPYEEVTKAVRGGSVPQFEQVVSRHQALFKEDGTLTLIMRLRYNVIKTGLRKINVSYSRISLEDICKKLGLESVEDATGICGKAIADGVISASIDFEQNALVSKGLHDVYSTAEPQAQLHKRIAFCLQLYNDCVRGMEYPSKKDNQQEDVDPTKEARELDEILADSDTDDIDML
ncbi:unnamed protein product [Amoebophrya sp. A25]|nr:unnamed protein product [Amoebophrya sp. A25]|eukprot:GSA25T00020821001.1